MSITKGDDPVGDATGIGDEGSSGSEGSDETASEPGNDDGPWPGFDVGIGETTTAEEEEEECASVTESAQATLQPADIIFVVDNSGSMQLEASAVQANMNNFSTQITNSGVDVQVVLISSYPGGGYGICIDPPLGGGGCPGSDNNAPVFTHVNQFVGSNQSLTEIIDHHNDWSGAMRGDAAKHIVVVTDDNSNMGATSFDQTFLALDASYAGYKFHGIVSMENCPSAAAVGSVYIQLGALTGGLITDLCDQDFDPIFDLLSEQIIEGASLSCEYDIPEPPDGGEFDPTKVNVDFDDGSGLETIGYVDNPAACAGVSDGWHYDNPGNPAKIIACPQTCDRFQNLENAMIEIRFGCATIPAG